MLRQKCAFVEMTLKLAKSRNRTKVCNLTKTSES